MYRSKTQPRPTLAAVARALQAGLILSVEKTKSREDGGRQTVTVGPRRTAVADGCAYQIIYWRRGAGPQEDAYGSAHEAAKDFIAFVGRDRAWAAVQIAKNTKRMAGEQSA
jgi:hypothetical protein